MKYLDCYDSYFNKIRIYNRLIEYLFNNDN